MTKKLSKKLSEEFCNAVDSEGLSYWLLEYTNETYPGTEVELLIANARSWLALLNSKIEELKERYEIETQ